MRIQRGKGSYDLPRYLQRRLPAQDVPASAIAEIKDIKARASGDFDLCMNGMYDGYVRHNPGSHIAITALRGAAIGAAAGQEYRYREAEINNLNYRPPAPVYQAPVNVYLPPVPVPPIEFKRPEPMCGGC
ncbi:MAG: hypothetical protein ACREYF_11555 [Gammaproteobacteria bacterium]